MAPPDAVRQVMQRGVPVDAFRRGFVESGLYDLVASLKAVFFKENIDFFCFVRLYFGDFSKKKTHKVSLRVQLFAARQFSFQPV